MAPHILSLSLTIFTLFLISANGRTYQKIVGEENDVVDPSHFISTASARSKLVKTVSRASASSYTTNYTDVLGLISLVTQFPSLEQLTDDPCVPPIWNWIECNSHSTPRVIALDLNNRLLYGQIITDISPMDALQRIDLSQNFLYGLIPSFLGEIPGLQELNLAYNYLSGTVPNSLSCNNNLKLTLIGNTGPIYNSCSPSNNSPSSPGGGGGGGGGGDSDGFNVEVPTTNSRRTKKKSNLGAILGGTISAFVVFWAAVGAYAHHRHKAKTAAAVAQAQAQPKQGAADDVPMDELPMNAHAPHPSHQMSPSS